MKTDASRLYERLRIPSHNHDQAHAMMRVIGHFQERYGASAYRRHARRIVRALRAVEASHRCDTDERP